MEVYVTNRPEKYYVARSEEEAHEDAAFGILVLLCSARRVEGERA